MTKTALIAAPLAMVGYGVARIVGRSDGAYGPGTDWQVAHFLGLAGFLLFLPVAWHLRSHVRPGAAREIVTGATVLGLIACIVQFSVDIVQGFQAADNADLRRIQHSFTDLPGTQAAFYDIGPLLFYVGLVVLTALVAQAGRLPWWSPAAVLVSVVLPPITLNLIPATGLLILVALLPLRRTPHLRDRTAD